ncbi:MAG: hypothetical protein NC181_02000 [Clostridium sp.]|nr:hypothetical protein [Clostridium sp.]MCM1444079.1 hypothetical protein [Candidatus Amulumruptor caecigallinarius]
MKKNTFKDLVKLVFFMLVILFVGTGISQLLIDLICKHTSLSITEDEFYSLSGSIGIICSAIYIALYVKRKKLQFQKMKSLVLFTH